MDSLRALALGREAVENTAAATLYYLQMCEEFGHAPQIAYDTPNFRVNHRWTQRQSIPTTRTDQVTLNGRVDAVEIGWLLASAFGAPTSSSGQHDFVAGVNAGSLVTPTPTLTSKFYEGLTGISWLLTGGRVSELTLALDASNGTFTYNSTLMGNVIENGAVGTIAYDAAIPFTRPFAPWQTVLTRTVAGVTTAFCIVSFRMTLTNNIVPLYCTPTTAPGTTTEVGLRPSRYTQGQITGTFEIVYEYPGPNGTGADADTSFYNYRKDIPEGWVMQAIDPNVYSPDLGYVPTFRLELPHTEYTSGSLDRTNPHVLQSLSGSILWDATLGSGAKVRLINDKGATFYAGS